MPMSPRLLRPRASGLIATDPDARAYIAAVQIADASSLEPAVQRAIDDFVKGCKADGIWSAIKASCILMGARTLSGALTPLVGTAPTNNNFVSGDYSRKLGLTGGSGKNLLTNRANTADAATDCHMAVFPTATSGTSFQGVFGTDSGSGHISMFTTGTGGANLNFRFRSTTYHADAAGGSISGFLLGMSRASATEFSLRRRGSPVTVVNNSGNAFAFPLRILSAEAFAFSGSLSFYSMGSAVDLALLDTRVSALYNAIGAAIP